MSTNGGYLPQDPSTSLTQQTLFKTDFTGAIENRMWNILQKYAALPPCNLARDEQSIVQCDVNAWIWRPIYVTVLTLIFSAIAASTAIGYMTWKTLNESNGGYTAMISQRDEQNIADGTTYTIPGDGSDPWVEPEEETEE